MDTKLSLRDRKKIEVRERILNTALSEFLAKGPSNVTMQEIADHADVARTSVFNYFPTKMDLLAAIYSDFTSEVLNQLRSQPTSTFEDGITWLYRTISDTARKYVPILKEVAPLTLSGQPLRDHDQSIDTEIVLHLRALIDLGKSSGEIDEAIDTHKISELLLAIISITNHEWIGRDGVDDLFECHMDRFRLVHKGLHGGSSAE